MDLVQFRCYYCKCKFREFKDVIGHSVDVHSNEQLKIRFLSLNEVTGKSTYVRKDFGVLPSEIKAQGKNVGTSGQTNKDPQVRSQPKTVCYTL